MPAGRSRASTSSTRRWWPPWARRRASASSSSSAPTPSSPCAPSSRRHRGASRRPPACRASPLTRQTVGARSTPPTGSASASRWSSACASTRESRCSRGASSGCATTPTTRSRSPSARSPRSRACDWRSAGDHHACPRHRPRPAGGGRARRSRAPRRGRVVGARPRPHRRGRPAAHPAPGRGAAQARPLPPHLRHRLVLPRLRRGAVLPRGRGRLRRRGQRAPPRAPAAEPVRLQHLPRELTALTFALREPAYGKSEIRLVKIVRDEARHELSDVTVDVTLEGDFTTAYKSGDNSALLATDTMRNTVYALAAEHDVKHLERFGRVLVERFVSAGPT